MARRASTTRELPFVLATFGLAALAGLPLLAFSNPTGHDAVFYMPRYVEFYRNLTEGQLVPRWAPDLSLGYGEPLFLFTPPLFYYVVAGFHGLGIGFAAAANLGALAFLGVAAGAMYVLAREFYEPPGGLIAATAYVFAPYLLVNLYVRYAMGDFAAFGFAPLAAWSLLCFSRGAGPWALVVGAAAVACLVLSSNHVALMAIPALGGVVLGAALARRSPFALARGAFALALGLGLSAFFWLPAVAEREYVELGFAVKGAFSYVHHFVYPQQLAYSPWGYGGSVGGPDDGLSLSLGTAQVAAALGTAVLLVRSRARPVLPREAATLSPSGRRSANSVFMALAAWTRRSACWLALRAEIPSRGIGTGQPIGSPPYGPTVVSGFILVAACFFATDASSWLWERLTLLPFLQFPWRFLSVATVAVAFLCGGLGLFVPRSRPWGGIALAVVVLAFVAQGLPNARHGAPPESIGEGLSPREVADWGLMGIANGFAPIWANELPREPVREALSVLSGRAQWSALEESSAMRRYSVTVEVPARLRLNHHYFPGWTLEVNGLEQVFGFANPLGAMEFDLPPGDHTVLFELRDTPVRVAGGRLALASLVTLVLGTAGWAWVLLLRRRLAGRLLGGDH